MSSILKEYTEETVSNEVFGIQSLNMMNKKNENKDNSINFINLEFVETKNSYVIPQIVQENMLQHAQNLGTQNLQNFNQDPNLNTSNQ